MFSIISEIPMEGLSVERLKELSQKIASNPDAVYDLEPQEVIEVRKYLNPLGNVITGKKVYANISLVNWKEKYMRRLLMTALVGYQYRTLEEYEPTEELEREKREYAAKLAKLGKDAPAETLSAAK